MYCPGVDASSVSHIIPEFLGKGPRLRSGVCATCNRDFNQRVEQKAAPQFSAMRALMGLNKKDLNRSPEMPVEAVLLDSKFSLSVRKQADLESRMLVFKGLNVPGLPQGGIAFIGTDPVEMERKIGEYEARHPGVVWNEIEPQLIADNLEFRFTLDYGIFFDDACRRIAAKIALEWWCHRRSSDHCSGSGFREVAEYAMTGNACMAEPVEIVVDRKFHAGLANVPFGNHVLATVQDARSRRLTVIVGLFAWVYYKIVLCSGYSVANAIELTLVNPQTGSEYVPPFVRSRPRVLEALGRSRAQVLDRRQVVDALRDPMLARINAALHVKNGFESQE